MTNVFADKPWYRDRRVAERIWQGLLVEAEVVAGPRTRVGLTHALRTKGQEILIYAAGVEDVLAPFLGRRVTIVGKWVNLTSEGFGMELWIGQIEIASPSS